MEFDTEITQVLERCYQGHDITHRRRFTIEKINPAPEETILDLGCGNGLLSVELARAVGINGKILGVDPSDNMRGVAELRCEEFPWVELHSGEATEIPCKDSSIDKAVSLQVFEYIKDIPKALTELHRVLRPSGLVVIGDNHWDTQAWFSENPERMSRVMKAWDKHLTERCIAAVIPPLLRDAGFVIENIYPYTITDYQLKPDGMANMLMALVEQYVLSQKLLSEDDVVAWRDEQLALVRAGRFFYSITHFVVVARKA